MFYSPFTYFIKFAILAVMLIIALSLFELSLAYALHGGEQMTILTKMSATRVAVFGVAAGYSISFGHAVHLISKRDTSISMLPFQEWCNSIILWYEKKLCWTSSFLSPENRIPGTNCRLRSDLASVVRSWTLCFYQGRSMHCRNDISAALCSLTRFSSKVHGAEPARMNIPSLVSFTR